MEYKIPLWEHQLRAIELAKNRDSFALFFEQGCGKTATLINILRHVYVQNGVLSTLILCPPIVIENWKREFLAHSKIRKEDIVCLRGSGFQRMCDLEKALRLDAKVVITNYESLYMDKLLEKLKAWQPQAMVLDESHKCKDISTKRTKRAIAIGKGARFRYILSGTPVVNSPFDIFSQFLFLDNGETFTDNYRVFRAKYFIDMNAHMPKQCYFPDWQPRMNAMKDINKLIYTKAMRVEKKDCLDLPPFVRQEVQFELKDDQKKVYREILKDCVTQTSEGTISADLAIKKGLRLQQITTGFCKTDDDKILTFSPNPRISALEEVIRNISPKHKIIIWAVFKQNYKDIAALLESMEIPYVEVHGEIPEVKKRDNIDTFNSARSAVRVLIGHPASCGVGANLTAASYSIFYSRDFSLENDLQAEARNYRGGSEVHEKITRIDIVASETIDEAVLEALSNKQMISDSIINYYRSKS